MYELFVRTLSQGLQAFMPVAVFLAYARRDGRTGLAVSARWAIVLALPLTFVAESLFRTTAYQARWEALLAIATVVITSRLLAEVLRRPTGASADPTWRPWFAVNTRPTGTQWPLFWGGLAALVGLVMIYFLAAYRGQAFHPVRRTIPASPTVDS